MRAKRFLTPAEVARYWRLNVHTIYRRIRSGDMPAVRLPGGELRIEESAAMSYGRRIAAGAHGRHQCTTVDNARQ